LNDSTLALGVLCSSMSADPIEGWLQYTINSNKKEVVKQHYQSFLYPKDSERKWQGVKVKTSNRGGYVLMGENYFSQEVRTTDFQTGRTYSNWVQHFNEIYFQALKSDFSVQDSMIMIGKRQEVLEGEGCSFKSFESQGKWNLEYNDAEENEPFGRFDRTWTGRKGGIRQVMLAQGERQVDKRKLANEMLKKKGIWVPVDGSDGKLEVWWTINEILICRD